MFCGYISMTNKKTLLALGFLLLFLGVYYFHFLGGDSFLWEDMMYMTYPEVSYLATSLASGRFPLWLSGLRDGIPFFSQQWAYYPPVWLLSLFVVDGKLSPLVVQWYTVAHLFLGGVGAFVFFRANRIGVWGALAGMTVFIFSAFPSLHIIHGAMDYVYLWLPLELYFVKKISEDVAPVKHYCLLVLCVWLSFLAGFPQLFFYNAVFLAAYWMFLYMSKEWLKGGVFKKRIIGMGLAECLKIAAVFGVVLLLGSFLIIATAQNWSLSQRQEFGFAEIADLSLPWYYLIHGLVPNFFGSVNGDGSGLPFWGFNRDTIGFRTWNAGYWMYFDFGFYAGQLALIAIGVMIFNVRKVWRTQPEAIFFLASIPLVMWLMLGRYGGLFNILYHVVPGLSLFRSPARIGCLFEFSAAMLVAYVVHELAERKLKLNFRWPLIGIGVLYVFFWLWFLAFGEQTFPELKDALARAHALKQLGLSLMAFLLTAAVIELSLRYQAGKGSAIAAIIIIVIVFADLYLSFHCFHQGKIDPRQYYGDRNGLMGRLTDLRDQNGPFRFAQLKNGKLSEEVVFPRNIGYLYSGYEALEGYILFNLKDWSAFNQIKNDRPKIDIQNVGVIANADLATGKIGLMRYTNSLPRVKFYHDLRSYGEPGALYADLDAGRLDYHRTLGVLRDECVKYGVVTSPPPADARARVRFQPVNSDEYRISYETTAPGVIFVSESFYPGWQADGGRYPLIRSFGAFKGIVIPHAGSGVITVKFSPRVLWVGLALSGSTLCVLLTLLAVVIYRGRKTRGRL